MRRWIAVAGIGIGALIAVGTLLVWIGRSVWSQETARAVAQLRGGASTDGTEAELPITRASLVALPAPVARYFAVALPEGQPPIRAATVRWAGDFRSRPAGDWAPFTAVQYFTAHSPGFVWDATIRMLPLVPVLVRDGYRDRTGTMHGRIGGVVPVVEEGGTPEMAQSALARWLGEAVWFPTALLPGTESGRGIRWEAVDDSTARATVTDGAITATGEFHFAPTGEIVRMTALRYRDVGGTAVLTPFEGRYGKYEQRAGAMVPARAEVAWLLPEGYFAYWRGRPERIEYEYEFASAPAQRAP